MKTIVPFVSLSLVAAAAQVHAQSPAPTAPPPSPTPLVALTPPPGLPASPSPSPNVGDSSGNWDPLAEMQRMENEMNQFFSRATNEFGLNQNFLSMRNEPGFASSIDVRDKGDHYEVHAFLPGIDLKNVKVVADSNNMLRVSASQSKQEKKNANGAQESVSEFGEYEQLVTLPGPAVTKQMKVDRKEHEVVITIPKKK